MICRRLAKTAFYSVSQWASCTTPAAKQQGQCGGGYFGSAEVWALSLQYYVPLLARGHAHEIMMSNILASSEFVQSNKVSGHSSSSTQLMVSGLPSPINHTNVSHEWAHKYPKFWVISYDKTFHIWIDYLGEKSVHIPLSHAEFAGNTAV